jgi:hypothetical protein
MKAGVPNGKTGELSGVFISVIATGYQSLNNMEPWDC